jgi:hypothetical protein
MTDRLSTLLHQEASGLDVPPPPAADVLAQGRRLRRERRTRTALAGALAAAVVAAGAVVTMDRLHGEAVGPADQPAFEQRGAWADGDQVHVGNHVVTVPDAAWVSYSSAGALVGSLDVMAAGPEDRSSVTLVSPDGRTRELGEIGIPAADPGTPVVVYARKAQDPGTWELVALDLDSGEERTVATPWRAKRSPDLSMSGDRVVYVRRNRMVTVDWRTGEQGRMSALPEIGMTLVQSFGRGGYLTTPQPLGRPTRTWHLRSLGDGTLRGTFPDGGAGVVQMSPDGRYVMTGDGTSVTVYDVATQQPTPLGLPGQPRDYGWTPDGHVVGPEDGDPANGVTVCDPRSGACDHVGGPVEGRLAVVSGPFDTGTPG